MRLSDVLFRALLGLLGPAIAATLYVYNYPFFHGCQFPSPPASAVGNTSHTSAPFRLLAYGDPQLEGDSSLPDPNAPWFPSLERAHTHWTHVTAVDLPGLLFLDILAVLFNDCPRILKGYRKRIDLAGNDLYLAHIHRALYRYTRPTHVSVLGDLLGSQWISDEEFARRASRFWGTVFKGTEKVPDALMAGAHGQLDDVLGDWSRYLINVAGNHDIGYAGDIGPERIERFEDAFGQVNWAVDFTLPGPENDTDPADRTLRVVVLNTMNIDSPAWSHALQKQTNDFLTQQVQHLNTTTRRHATVLLTHIPLFKEEGLCSDGPFWTYFPAENGAGVQEQNHLSADASARILALFEQRAGIVLNGHDHEGCRSWHFRRSDSGEVDEVDKDRNVALLPEESVIGDGWATALYASMLEVSGIAAQLHPGSPAPRGVEEVTVRSMMGSFGGNAGLLSAWFDEHAQKWVFEYRDCAFGVQHIWWAVHGLDLVTGVVAISWLVSLFV